MILCKEDIEAMCVADPKLVMPFRRENVRLSSYDLTVGNEYYGGHDGSSQSIETTTLEVGQSFVIPPHGICFILAGETITLPSDVSAKLSLRMPFVYRGLVLTSQPPFDPGYHGKAVVMVHNLASQPHSLKQGERLATIEFARVSKSPTAQSSAVGPATGSPPKQSSVRTLQSQLPAAVSSSLVEISGQAKGAQKRVDWLMAQLLVAVGILVAIIAIPAAAVFNTLADRISDLRSKTEELGASLKLRDLELDDLKKKMTLKIEAAAVQPPAPAGARTTKPSRTPG